MSRCTLDPAMSLTFSLTGLSPSPAGLSRTVLLTFGNQLCSPNPEMHASRFGLFRFRSPLLTESIVFFLFLRLLRCFSSPGSLRIPMDSVYGDGTLLPPGFPIRKSVDIMFACNSPQLIAACHVLLRLLMPRHSPYALISLIFILKFA